MGIVGVNSTVGRAVKCIDPGKTTKSESSWLGYTLCDLIWRNFTSVLLLSFAKMHSTFFAELSIYTVH